MYVNRTEQKSSKANRLRGEKQKKYIYTQSEPAHAKKNRKGKFNIVFVSIINAFEMFKNVQKCSMACGTVGKQVSQFA